MRQITFIYPILMAFALSGCSALSVYHKFEPTASAGWSLKSTDKSKKESSEHDCTGYSFHVDSITGGGVMFIGPPLLPLIPVAQRNSGTIMLTISGDDLGTVSCPIVKISNKQYTAFSKDLAHTGKVRWCYYDLPLPDAGFALQFENQHNSCEVQDLNFKFDTDWEYRPLWFGPES